MIIDANVHISADGKWYHTPHDASFARLKSNIEEAGIDLAIVVPLPGLISNTEQKAIIRDERSMFSACTFNPADYANPKDAADAFVRDFSEVPKTMVKFHNRFGKYHPLDERFIAVIEANDKLNTPMLIGVCGLLHDRNIASAVNTATYFFDLAKKIERSQLVIMHGGGTQILQIAELCRDLHHVYIDLSMTVSKYKNTSIASDIKWLCHHYDRRMIWGSDFPEVSISESLQDIKNILGEIAPEKLNNILGINIGKLLNIAVN